MAGSAVPATTGSRFSGGTAAEDLAGSGGRGVSEAAAVSCGGRLALGKGVARSVALGGVGGTGRGFHIVRRGGRSTPGEGCCSGRAMPFGGGASFLAIGISSGPSTEYSCAAWLCAVKELTTSSRLRLLRGAGVVLVPTVVLTALEGAPLAAVLVVTGPLLEEDDEAGTDFRPAPFSSFPPRPAPEAG